MSHHDFDSESALVACALRDPAAFWATADLVTGEDFRDGTLRAIWTVIGDQLRKGGASDAVTVGEVAPDLFAAAVDIARDTVASERNARAYAERVASRALDRKVKVAGQRIANLSGDDALGEAQKILGACVPRTGSSIGTLGQFVRKSLAGIMERGQRDAELVGVETGFKPLDELTGGWQRSDLVIIAARPSVGKTAFALQSSIAAARAGHPALFVSLEMNGTQLADRAVSHLTGVNAMAIRDPRNMEDEDWPRLTAVNRITDDLPMRIDESASATVDAIAARARQVDAEQRLSLIVIDYLTYIQPPKSENTTEAIQVITRHLKALAKQLNVTVVLLSQLNRDGDGEPELKHLRGSGAIEQDADVVLFLHRPNASDHGLVKAKVAKQRNGPLGEFYLRADMANMRFTPTEYSPPAVEFKPRSRGFGGQRRYGNDD